MARVQVHASLGWMISILIKAMWDISRAIGIFLCKTSQSYIYAALLAVSIS